MDIKVVSNLHVLSKSSSQYPNTLPTVHYIICMTLTYVTNVCMCVCIYSINQHYLI